LATRHISELSDLISKTLLEVPLLAALSQLVLVVGAPASSNSNRLAEVATKRGVEGHLIENAGQIEPAWLAGVDCVGVTAGASTPEFLVQQVVERLLEIGGTQRGRVDS
jgi:4-hydroxy-3-methylbut-2-enyl diphosphate reductase